jgi:hypothetical protein
LVWPWIARSRDRNVFDEISRNSAIQQCPGLARRPTRVTRKLCTLIGVRILFKSRTSCHQMASMEFIVLTHLHPATASWTKLARIAAIVIVYLARVAILNGQWCFNTGLIKSVVIKNINNNIRSHKTAECSSYIHMASQAPY